MCWAATACNVVDGDHHNRQAEPQPLMVLLLI